VLQTLNQIVKSVLTSALLLIVVNLAVLNAAYSADVEVQAVEQLQNLVAQKSYARALETINSLPQEVQLRLDIRFYRATSLAGVGQNGEAIEAFERLLKDAPQHPEFYNNLAMLLVEEGRLLEAQQALELGLRSRESYAMLYNNLTVVFETMARRSYAQALRVRREQSPVLSPLLSLQDFSLSEEQVVHVVASVDDNTVPVAMTTPAVDREALSQVDTRGSVESQAAGSTKVKTVAVDEQREALKQQIERLLNHWIKSWQKQDINGYIDSYSPNFKSRAYSSHEAWVKGRRERIERAKRIDITIEKINIKSLSSDRIQVEFMMDYRSDRYSDRSKKRVIFRLMGGEWRIVRELTLKVMSS